MSNGAIAAAIISATGINKSDNSAISLANSRHAVWRHAIVAPEIIRYVTLALLLIYMYFQLVSILPAAIHYLTTTKIGLIPLLIRWALLRRSRKS